MICLLCSFVYKEGRKFVGKYIYIYVRVTTVLRGIDIIWTCLNIVDLVVFVYIHIKNKNLSTALVKHNECIHIHNIISQGRKACKEKK